MAAPRLPNTAVLERGRCREVTYVNVIAPHSSAVLRSSLGRGSDRLS
jgi:hypothetical protein